MNETIGAAIAERVGAIVVNYEAGAHLQACVSSLRLAGVREIVVVDNRSRDGSIGMLRSSDPDVTVVRSERNLGYGGAANLGSRRAASELLLICNPDVIVGPGSVEALVAALDADEAVGIVGPLIRGIDGERYPSARAFPSLVDSFGHGFAEVVWPGNPWSRRYKLLDHDAGAPAEVGWVSGSCFLARRTAFDSVGGFDESYFMYVEDVDLCWRIGRAGWKVRYEPSAEVVHARAVSTERRPYRMIVAHHRSLWRFACRSAEGKRRAALPMIAFGLVLRAALCLAGRRARSARARSANWSEPASGPGDLCD